MFVHLKSPFPTPVQFLLALKSAKESCIPQAASQAQACAAEASPAITAPPLAWRATSWAIVIGTLSKPKEILTLTFCGDGPAVSATPISFSSCATASRQPEAGITAEAAGPAPPAAHAAPPAVQTAAHAQLRRTLRTLLLAHDSVPAWSKPAGNTV